MNEKFKSHSAPTTRKPGVTARPNPGQKPISKEAVDRALEDARAAQGNGSEPDRKKEIGGRGGLEPTRYGDWEIGGKCVDF